jgi:O-antigen/teichoic acid export membrane protein
LQGIVWSAIASWLQLLLGLVTFFILARYLTPVSFGTFGAAMLVVGAADMLMGPTLTQSLEQRPTLDRDHIDATLFYAVVLSPALGLAVCLAAPLLEQAVGVEQGAEILRWLAIGLPLAAIGGVPTAILSRELRFGAIAQVATASGLVGSLTAISVMILGGGVWALVAAELAGRAVRCVGAFICCDYRPAWPRKLTSFHDLLPFNAMTLTLCSFGYLDGAVAKLLTARMFGAAELGYYGFAQRVYELLTYMLLEPINRVVMTSVARLHGDAAARRALIVTLYRLSTSIAYPGFLAAIILVPDFVALQGAQWKPAITTMQILLFVGLRTATGTFNFGILRGSGRSRGPLLLFALGLALQLVFIPLGAKFSIAGVALAVLARTVAIWPLGCWLVRRATGLSVAEQIRPGADAFLAALVMCAIMQLTLTFGVADQSPVVRLIAGFLVGLPTYGVAMMAISPVERQVVVSVCSALKSGERSAALGHVRAYLGQLG